MSLHAAHMFGDASPQAYVSQLGFALLKSCRALADTMLHLPIGWL